VVGEARKEERKWEALWSYRANPPTVGDGEMRSMVPLDSFLGMLGLVDVVKPAELPEITDEEIEDLMRRGRMGWIPPGG
jgi:hypothetical protein